MSVAEKVARAITRASCTGPKAHLDEQESYWRSNGHLAKAALTVLANELDESLVKKAVEAYAVYGAEEILAGKAPTVEELFAVAIRAYLQALTKGNV